MTAAGYTVNTTEVWTTVGMMRMFSDKNPHKYDIVRDPDICHAISCVYAPAAAVENDKCN